MIRTWVASAAALLVAAGAAAACVGSTGGELFELDAYASGPADRVPGSPYVFDNDRGFTVTLEVATLHVGAVYLNQSVPTSVGSDTSCVLPGIYVAEVTEGLSVDLLDPTPRPFPVKGSATTDRARTAEVWLTGGDIDAEQDPTVVATAVGVAVRGTEIYPFEASITIGENRALPPVSDAQPGSRPICKQRVVSPIVVDFTPEPGGALLLTVDPAGWFGNVDFSALERVSEAPLLYRFRDDSEDQPSRNLYAGIRASAGVYELTWLPDPLAE